MSGVREPEHLTRRKSNLCAPAPDVPNIFLFTILLIEFPISCACHTISQDKRLLNIMIGQHTLRQQEATQSASKLYWHFGAIYFIMTIPYNFCDESENQLKAASFCYSCLFRIRLFSRRYWNELSVLHMQLTQWIMNMNEQIDIAVNTKWLSMDSVWCVWIMHSCTRVEL